MVERDVPLQVSVEETTVLGRKLKIEIPVQEVQHAYRSVVQKAQKSLKLPGFRPGKVPKGILEKRYQEMLQADLLQNLAPTHMQRALEQLSLTPATRPHLHEVKLDKERPLVVEAEFEVVPEFALLDISEFSIKPAKIAVNDDQIQERIEALQKSHATPQEKTGKAVKGDVVQFDFSGRLDGALFEGGSGQNQQLELGQERFLKEFETAMLGMEKGESKTFPLQFPQDYQAAHLAGKEVAFSVVVGQVSQLLPAALDKAFFSRFGPFEDMPAFRGHIKAEIAREAEHAARAAQQSEMAEQISQKYVFPVPEILVKEALQSHERQVQKNTPKVMEDKEKWETAQSEERKRIENALRLSYVIEAVARARGFEPDANDIRERFMLQAQMMRQDPQKLIHSELGERLLRQVRERLLHERILDTLCKEVLGEEAPQAAAVESVAAKRPSASKKTGAKTK